MNNANTTRPTLLDRLVPTIEPEISWACEPALPRVGARITFGDRGSYWAPGPFWDGVRILLGGIDAADREPLAMFLDAIAIALDSPAEQEDRWLGDLVGELSLELHSASHARLDE